MFTRTPSAVKHCILTILVVTLATLLRFALDPVLDLRAPFILYFPAVVLCAWFGGVWPGLLATALGSLTAWYVFFPPQYSFRVADPTAPAQLIIFVLGNVFVSLLAESLHRARRSTEESEVRERQQRERFRVTLASIGDAVIATDAQGRVTFINQVAESLTGWGQLEASGKPLAEIFKIIDAQTRQSAEDPVARVLQEGKVVGLANHTRLIGRNGTETPIDDSAAPIRNEGNLIGVVLVFRDVTERNRNEEMLRESRAQLVGMIASAMDAIITIGDAERIVVFNAAAEQMFRCSREEAIGQSLDMFMPERFRRTHQDHVHAFKEAGVTKRSMGTLGAIFGVRADGEEFPIEASISQIGVKGQKLCTVILRDVTQRLHADEERIHLLETAQAARAEAEAANNAKDEFLATVSHELRTPLSAILGWVRLLGMGQLDPQSAEKAVETIERNAKVQAQLIEDLLDVSRIISGKMRIDYEPVNLVSAIEAALESVRPAAQAKSIQLKAKFDSTAGAVMGDATRLQQIIWNLLSNAVKFTSKDGRVEIRVERADSQAQVTVSDTGRGISPQFLPRVFERFQQADGKDARQHGGLGLGLAIVRNLVEMHGGSVEADSLGEGQGATFTVRLPLRAVQTEIGKLGKGQATESRDLFDRLPALDGVSVLAVDDESSAREIITAVLTQCGATVTAVASAADAIAALAHVQPDVLVSDIGMPDENGYELITKVRKLKPEQGGSIPAVALTAYAKTEDRMRALAAGFQTHVPKPVEPAELALVVASLVEHAKAARQAE